MALAVLVVDDEPDMQPLFEQQFRKERRSGVLSFQFARSGEEALSLLEAEGCADYVLILSDINMPGMHGLELLSILKERYPQIQVCMVTAYDQEEQRQKAQDLGADAYLTKPLDFKLLRQRIMNL